MCLDDAVQKEGKQVLFILEISMAPPMSSCDSPFSISGTVIVYLRKLKSNGSLVQNRLDASHIFITHHESCVTMRFASSSSVANPVTPEYFFWRQL